MEFGCKSKLFARSRLNLHRARFSERRTEPPETFHIDKAALQPCHRPLPHCQEGPSPGVSGAEAGLAHAESKVPMAELNLHSQSLKRRAHENASSSVELIACGPGILSPGRFLFGHCQMIVSFWFLSPIEKNKKKNIEESPPKWDHVQRPKHLSGLHPK